MTNNYKLKKGGGNGLCGPFGCKVPLNPTPSSYWPGPVNPAPPNPVPSPNCQLSHFRPLVLSQFGGSRKKRLKKTRRLRKHKGGAPRGGKNYKKTRKNKKGGRWIIVQGNAPGQLIFKWIDEYDTDEDD